MNITSGGPNLSLQPPTIMNPINGPHVAPNMMINQQNNMIQNQNFMPKQPIFSRPILIQQQRKMGQIDVIGSTENTSRRPNEINNYHLEMNMNHQNQISVLGANNL